MLIPCRATLIGSGSAWLAGANIARWCHVVFGWLLHRNIADASVKRAHVAVICFVNFITPFRIVRLLTDFCAYRLIASLADIPKRCRLGIRNRGVARKHGIELDPRRHAYITRNAIVESPQFKF